MNQQSLSLPPKFTLRRASVEDIWTIRKIVFSAKLDPTQLNWQQFWLIENNGEIIACGQLRNFSEAQELGSLVVKSPWRRQGLGVFLVNHLISEATKPLYLECLGDNLAHFYSRFGFVAIPWQELPPSLIRKFGLSQLARQLIKLPITFMQYKS